jgi:amino acid transporter
MKESCSLSEFAEGQSGTELKRNTLSVWKVVFLVVSAASPLSAMLGAVPPAVSLGNGAGVPGAYVIAGLILLIFSVGYAAMSRHMIRAGAFYAYVTAGFGRPFGVGGALLALASYSALQIALYGLFGFFCTVILAPVLHSSLPWYGYSLLCLAAVQIIGVRGIDLNSRLLGLLMVLEMGILLVLSVAIMLHGGGPQGLSAAPFSPRVVFSGHPGIAIMFALASFIGFEATAIYGKECDRPEVAVPRATYISVLLIQIFFAFVTWAIVCAYGAANVVTVANQHPGEFWFIQSAKHLGEAMTTTMSFLLISSIFASLLSFHNTLVRYIHSLSIEGVLPRVLKRAHPKYGSPHRASYLQTISVLVPLVLFILCGSDAFGVVFSWGVAFGTIGIVALQALTSFSIALYFLRTGKDTRVWHTLIAPVLGGIGLASVGWILSRNLDVFSGSSSAVVQSFPLAIAAIFAIGIVIGIVLRQTKPDVYRRFGQ